LTVLLTEKQKHLRDTLLLSPAKHSLIYGGSRSGKTFLYCYAIATRALRSSGSRHAIFRRHGVAVKQSIGKDTMPKVLELAYDGAAVEWKEQDGYFAFPNGSEVWLAGLDDKDRVDKVLGKEFATLYFNEASEIPYQSYLVAQTRLAQKVDVTAGDGVGEPLPLKSYVDLNPTTESHWTYKLYVQGIEPESKKPLPKGNYVYGVANPLDNAENLAPDYIESLKFLPEAQKRRFFLGEFSGDKADALWSRGSIKKLYVLNDAELPDFRRVVVAIDPAVSTESGSNETGIVVTAIDAGGMGYVLADGSGVMKPEEWARKAITLYHYYKADAIVCENNQGGDLVEANIRGHAPDLPVKQVRATRGKYVRAEPIAALYARDRIRHAGDFEELENQQCNFTSDFDRKGQGYSPDRVDALVWGFTELFPGLIDDRRDKTPRAAVAQDFDPFNFDASTYRDRPASSGGDYSPF
jgi:phage terminase large subunit